MKTLHGIFYSFMLIGSTHVTSGMPSFKKSSHTFQSVQVTRETFNYFRAHRQGSGVTLNWGMSSMADVDYFRIERSDNGEFFNYFLELPNNGSNRQSWRDGSVFPGYNHYRVVYVMNDGTEIYTETKTVRIVQHG